MVKILAYHRQNRFLMSCQKTRQIMGIAERVRETGAYQAVQGELPEGKRNAEVPQEVY